MRLATKITFLIVAVLIVGFGASTVWTIQREHQLLAEQSKAAARRLAASIVASIESAMLQERPDVTRALLDEMRGATPVEGLTIYRRNGVEAFTDMATVDEVRRNADLAPEVLANIEKMRREPTGTMSGPLFARALQTLEIQESIEEAGGVPLFVLHYPVPNQERCQGCHGTDHTVRAVVRVATSMAPVVAEMRRQRNRLLTVAVLTIVVAAGLLTVAMRRVVVRPLGALTTVARRIGEGDFEVRAPAASRDEIGVLGAALNDMTGRLAQAYRDLEARNAELAATLQDLRESRQRLALLEQLKGELSKFVPDAVKRLLERDPNATELEKRTVEVSVLFLDVAGYTRLSEQLEPRRLNLLIQVYFSAYLEIVQAHHGDVNETAGDGLMVIFQSERGGEDHALNATRAAFEIRRRTQALNEEHEGTFPEIQLHMGVNTGQALVGATKLGGGGSQRWTFTATGPTTNLAARLAGSTAGGEIVVGPLTAERIRGHFVLEALGEQTFKNVSSPVRVFRVIPPGVYERVV